jgi:long-chain acyl-CoA synthetase
MQPWHNNYLADVAHEIDTQQYSSMMDLFQQTTQTFQDKTAYISFGATLSFNQLLY